MTLEKLREAKHEDIFLAVINRPLTWEEAENLTMYTEEYPDGIRVSDAVRKCVEEAILENKEPLTEENIKRIEDDLKNNITSHLEESTSTILWKKGKSYIELSGMVELNSDYKIQHLVEINRYYSEEEYSFEVDKDGKPYLDLDLEPFDQFCKDCEEGKLEEL